MSYLDGMVAAVPAANREKYIKHAADAAVVFKDHGAIKIMECWGDDVPDGKVTSLPMAVKKADDEVVVFAFIMWPDKPTRDAGWKAIMEDPRMQPGASPMPFDGQRMIFGGFQPVLEA
ncbi:DUF1428 domain-containing protein [Acuticoccus sediminis]|uniref:DUF1428 domain-containing protein n=1 Tax=Acuticoccus sediminis TaxID=2184697 RepID=A0A8B2NU15_9HYPH|nr:DUF1428 domain-containing protein [Acuticoccus sediminis]RAI00653.1 DUF1428 domain-containing protein [Acuticoccus sediminis]